MHVECQMFKLLVGKPDHNSVSFVAIYRHIR